MSKSDSPAWQEYGYYEMYIPVWNPNEGDDENTIRNLTIDIVGNEEKLEQISPNLASEIAKYGEHIDETSDIEKYVAGHLRSLIRSNLISDAMCDDFGISDVSSLKARLDDDDFEVFPL